MDRQIQSLIGSSDEALGIYASQADDLGSLIDDLDAVGGKLAGMTDAINSLLVNFSGVQEELDHLLSRNRGNIDATLSGLLDLTRLLDDNRYALERTLCTLPAGIVPYDMTSSWGEWFNVRITEFTFKDRESDLVSSSKEEQEAPGRVEEPFVCSPEQRGRAAPAVGATGTGSSPDPTSLGSWLDSVIGRHAGG